MKPAKAAKYLSAGQWLDIACRKLTAAGIGTAELDSLVLLEDVTSKDRAYLLAHPETPLSKQARRKLNALLKQRTIHMPLAYVRGFTEFYGRNFIVNKNVLEPRPESETMIDLLKDLSAQSQGAPLLIVDVGTGSGALAITTKLELPSANVLAIDIDPKCLVVAHQNAKMLGANVDFVQGDLLTPLPTAKYQLQTILLANLPYVPSRYQINRPAAHEPRIAIFGGPDGLEIYRNLFKQTEKLDPCPQIILTEALPSQHAEMIKLAELSSYKLIKTLDFIQVFCPR
ncbi:MAG: HemK/PrmC family methyltransferase [Candidatus Saccharimonadales bacterium]